LRGTRQDFSEVPIRGAILLLAVPVILERAMESLFAIVDTFWVARLGAEAAASVSLLALAAAVGLRARALAPLGSGRCVHRHYGCVVNVCRRGRGGF
jgi:Na+-driven multidrug efflux pump